ncbi:MAG: hypothetical protein MJZ26_01420 [Fibrobacter sp.]|nr:hypothetical protein [Fibrobacter sp.]
MQKKSTDRKSYAKPCMKVVTLKHRTSLLQASMNHGEFTLDGFQEENENV